MIQVVLAGDKVTDLVLKDLNEFKQLTRLLVYATPVTDAGLKDIKELQPATMLLNLPGHPRV